MRRESRPNRLFHDRIFLIERHHVADYTVRNCVTIMFKRCRRNRTLKIAANHSLWRNTKNSAPGPNLLELRRTQGPNAKEAARFYSLFSADSLPFPDLETTYSNTRPDRRHDASMIARESSSTRSETPSLVLQVICDTQSKCGQFTISQSARRGHGTLRKAAIYEGCASPFLSK